MSVTLDAAGTVALAGRVAELEQQLHAVQTRHHLLRRVHALRDRLTRAVLEGGEETAVAAAVAAEIGRPCAITGPDLVFVAGRDAAGRVWRPALVAEDVRTELPARELLATLSQTCAVVLPPVLHLDARHRTLVGPRSVHGLRVWLAEYGGAFSALDRAALRHAAAALALLWASVPADVPPAEGLLAGGYDDHVLHRWCRALGLDPLRPIAVLPSGALSAQARPGAVLAADAVRVATAWRELHAVAAAQDALGTGRVPPGADALGPARLLLGSGDPVAVDHFLDQILGPLGRPDGRSDHLIATLAAYLDESRSVGRTAARLDIHENTVRYRLKRTGQVLGRDLGQPEELLAAHVAILVLRMRGDRRVAPHGDGRPLTPACAARPGGAAA